MVAPRWPNRTPGFADFFLAGFPVDASASADGRPRKSVVRVLEYLRSTYPYSRSGNEGPQAVFGRIYQVLEFGREDKAFDPLRDLVGNFIRTRYPVGPGDVVFGKPVERRTRIRSGRSRSRPSFIRSGSGSSWRRQNCFPRPRVIS
jgi:hypothetical protein